jgi:hypothetical protein
MATPTYPGAFPGTNPNTTNLSAVVTSYAGTGIANVSATVLLSTGQTCTGNTTVTVRPPAWWQVAGGDVYGAGGVTSIIPAGCTPSSSCNISIAN